MKVSCINDDSISVLTCGRLWSLWVQHLHSFLHPCMIISSLTPKDLLNIWYALIGIELASLFFIVWTWLKWMSSCKDGIRLASTKSVISVANIILDGHRRAWALSLLLWTYSIDLAAKTLVFKHFELEVTIFPTGFIVSLGRFLLLFHITNWSLDALTACNSSIRW